MKLQSGEYISLGRVETVLKTSPLVENMFVYAEPLRSHVVAVVTPVPAALQALAAELSGGPDGDQSLEALCASPEMERAVQARLALQAKQGQCRLLKTFSQVLTVH